MPSLSRGVSSPNAARRFGYQPGAFRDLCWRFRHEVALKRAHNPKVAGSNLAPATIENKALEDVNPPRPFVRHPLVVLAQDCPPARLDLEMVVGHVLLCLVAAGPPSSGRLPILDFGL